jgi:hypothetical protein
MPEQSNKEELRFEGRLHALTNHLLRNCLIVGELCLESIPAMNEDPIGVVLDCCRPIVSSFNAIMKWEFKYDI